MINEAARKCRNFGTAALVTSFCAPVIVPFILLIIALVNYSNAPVDGTDTAARGKRYAVTALCISVVRISLLIFMVIYALSWAMNAIIDALPSLGRALADLE